MPGEAFGAPGYARLSFALGDDVLAEGIGRIAKFLAWPASPSCPGVLVTEELAGAASRRCAAAGLDVDVRLGPLAGRAARRGERRRGARHPERDPVTAEVLEAGAELVVVGRAGIGLDNVDVEAATRRGVMVVNAPQSNVLSAAEHTLALLLAQARNVPQANRDLKAGSWNRSRWEGVELHGKTLGIIGLGRVGVLVAQRALAFGMHLVAYDPYVSVDRARQLGVDLVGTVEEAVARCRLPHRAPAEDSRHLGLDLRRSALPGEADPARHQHGAGRDCRRSRAGGRGS